MAPANPRCWIAVLLAGLLMAGSGARAEADSDVVIIAWSLERTGEAMTLSGTARNTSMRNLNAVVVEAVFYGPGGAYLGSVLARSEGRTFPPGRNTTFQGLGLWAEGMDTPIVRVRDIDGRPLTAVVPGTLQPTMTEP